MNTYYVAGIPFDGYNALSHHGIKGQKWGIRRFQNPDGTLTEEGLVRYSKNRKYEKSRSSKDNKAQKMDDYFKGKQDKKWFSNDNTTDSYNDHEYYAFEYQDDPVAKKAIKEALKDAYLINKSADTFVRKSKEEIDLWVKYSDSVITDKQKRTGDYNEQEVYNTVKERYSDFDRVEKEAKGARTFLRYAISASVDTGDFDSIFDEYPPISFRQDMYKDGKSLLIDGRKSVISSYIANQYDTGSYGINFLTPHDFEEYRELKI